MKNIIIVILLNTFLFSNDIMNDFINTLENNLTAANSNEKLTNATKKYIENYDNNKYTTIFYFVDSKVTNVMLKNFSNYINKLKRFNPNLMGKVMTRGLINDDFKETAVFFKTITEEEQIKNIEYYPIHFHSFKHFNLEYVPAYALSLCNSEFDFKRCEHKYLVKGDISLLSFLEIVSTENKEYLKLYNSLGEEE